MTKTIEDVQRLSAFFAPEDHEWLSGKTYIKEDKITARLDEIDPDWEFILAGCQRNGNSVSAYGTLIVCGVRRDGVGMDVARVKGEVEVNEAEKSAATDALKRAARLHGIGRYLLDLPKSVTDEKTLRDWMKAQKQSKPVQAAAPARRIPEEPAQSEPAANADGLLETEWQSKFEIFYTNGNAKQPKIAIGNVPFWTRDKLREAGFSDNDLAAMIELGKGYHDLAQRVKVVYTKSANGAKEAQRVIVEKQ